jgi:hypothetical protein
LPRKPLALHEAGRQRPPSPAELFHSAG